MSNRLSVWFIELYLLGSLGACNPDSLEPDIPVGTGSPSTSPKALLVSNDTLPAIADVLIRTAARHSNHGGALTMQIKITASQDDTTRAIVKFDQATIAAAIGSGTLTGASLELAMKESGLDAAGNDIDVHRVLKPWTEAGATWRCGEDLNTANTTADCPTTKWRMSGADMDALAPTRTARVHMNAGQTGLAQFDVTQDVLAFLAGTSNHGWLVTAGSPTSRTVVWSRESASKPRLVLSVNRGEAVPAQAPDAEPGAYPEDKLVHGSPELSGTFVRDILIVLFTPEATQAQRQSAIDRVQGTVIGGTRLTESDGFYIVRIPDTGSESALFEALAALDSLPYVVTAQPEMILDDPGLYQRPNDGGGFLRNEWALTPNGQVDANWALEDIRAPLAWGCSIGDAAVQVGVVDQEFFGSNPDVTPISAFRAGLYPGADTRTHGVRVSSALAATGNNDLGITGVMWKAGLRWYGIEQVDAGGHLITHPDGSPVYTSRAIANRLALAASRRKGDKSLYRQDMEKCDAGDAGRFKFRQEDGGDCCRGNSSLVSRFRTPDCYRCWECYRNPVP